MIVEGWLKKLEMAPKSKAHIRSIMHVMFECAARWELFNDRRNPIDMVRVKDSTKRRQRPAILTIEQYHTIISTLKEPYRTSRTIRPRSRNDTSVLPAAALWSARSAVFGQVYRILVTVVDRYAGNKTDARIFLNAPNRHLENQATVEFIERGELASVEAFVDAMSTRQPA